MCPILSFQAVKYLEGMLIQSQQAQKKQKKLAAEMDDLKLNEAGCGDDNEQKKAKEPPTKSAAPKESTTDGEAGEEAKAAAAEPQVKEEIIEDDEQEKAGATSAAESDKLSKSEGEVATEVEDGVAVDDNGEEGEEEEEEEDDDEDEIKINPRTYCKLGHFHLLLEDYAKGECRWIEEMHLLVY